jgi:putative ABC transport system ATP-binding protein
MSAVIVAEDLKKTYGEGEGAVYALRGVSLTVDKGEVLFVTGPSGSGKTTLISILGCVLRPSAGRATMLGRDLVSMTESQLTSFRLLQLGFIFQGHNLVASVDALTNVRLPLMLQGVNSYEADRRAIAELERVGLGDKLDRLPRDLSGGQRQRVAIARATVGRPAVIFADEPTASLDATAGREVMELLTELAREGGQTVVVVTHDSRIYPYADRIVAIEDGHLVGAPEEHTAPIARAPDPRTMPPEVRATIAPKFPLPGFVPRESARDLEPTDPRVQRTDPRFAEVTDPRVPDDALDAPERTAPIAVIGEEPDDAEDSGSDTTTTFPFPVKRKP